MSGAKGLLESKTVWGAILAIVSVIALKSGYVIGDVGEWSTALVALFGSLFSVYGRIKAVKKIGE